MDHHKEALEALCKELGLTISSEFVPFSKSRNAKEKNRTLNWKVTLKLGDRAILTTDYSAGVAHCPSYKIANRETVAWHKAINGECETGLHYNAKDPLNIYHRKFIFPDTIDVIASLVSDSDVLDSSSFEEWASDRGYDVDSRKAEKAYQECLKHALAFRAAVGDSGLEKLRTLAREL